MTTEKATVDKPFLASLREMEIGQSLALPIERVSYIRSACVTFGMQWGRKYKTSTSRTDRTITVIRTA